MDLGAVVGRILLDPGGLAQRVLESFQDQLQRDGLLPAGGDESPEELLAAALGTWLASKLTSPRAARERPASAFDDIDPLFEQRLVDQNQVLASALGACPCWGKRVECGTCSGAGGPGWKVPNPQLFFEYVQPAARRNSNGKYAAAAEGHI